LFVDVAQMRILMAYQPIEPMMDGVGYPKVNTGEIPRAYVTVDISIDNNGDKYEAMILAGVATRHISSSGDTSLSVSGKNDTISPGVSWWLFKKVSQEEIERRAKEKAQRWDAHVARYPHRPAWVAALTFRDVE